MSVPLTVASVLELEPLGSSSPRVIAGHDLLGSTVRWVHIAEEAGTSSLLEGGELVLTTGLEFRRSVDGARAFLNRFFGAGAAGVVVELVDEAGEPDGEAVAVLEAAAHDAAGPVAVLGRRTRFVQVTEQVHRILMDRQLARVERSRHVHEVFTQLSLENATEQRIVDTAAELMGGPVVFEDPAHLVLSYAGAAAGSGGLLDGWAERSRLVGYGTPLSGSEAAPVPAVWHQAPVGLRGQRWGRLMAPAASAADGGDRDDDGDALPVLERAAQALTIARMAGRDQRELLHQARAGLLHELRQPSPPDDADAAVRAATLGFAATPAYVPAVVRLDRLAGEPPTALQLRERALLDALEAEAAAARIPLLAASLRAGSLGLLVGLRAIELEEPSLRRLFGGLAEGGEDESGPAWTAGVGRTAGSIVHAALGLDGADHVAESAATLQARSRPFYRFADVRLRGLVALLGDDPRMATFAAAELGGLLEPHDDEGLDLLEKFLAHGGNKASLARSGYMSRQTLYARLAKLEARLGLPLDDPESQASLTVALLWHRLSR